MAGQLTTDDARQSLADHAAARGAEVFAKYGPVLGWAELQRLLADRAFVRYPCEIAFDAAPLEPGECAYAAPKGERPEDGFTVFVHPYFQVQLAHVPHLVLYQLVVVNYGEFASPNDAEVFGAAALGLAPDDYYGLLCELADELGGAVGGFALAEERGERGLFPCGGHGTGGPAEIDGTNRAPRPAPFRAKPSADRHLVWH
jgi:hypothetical protein